MFAPSIESLTPTVPALKSDVTAGRFVSFEGGLAGADEPVYGVSKHAGLAGDPLAICAVGQVPVAADAAIATGAVVYSDADGKATATGQNNPAGRCVRMEHGIAIILIR